MTPAIDLLSQALVRAIESALGFCADPQLAAASSEQFGDYQSNAALALARRVAETSGAKTSPRKIADQIVAALDVSEIADVEIAGPGFINLRLKPAFLQSRLSSIAASRSLGIVLSGEAGVVVVDYSAPNVAKEMHVGHLRSTIIGDCFVRVLEALGHTVIRQNHIGDWGTQFGRVILGLWYDAVARSAGQGDMLDGWIRNALKLAATPEGESPETKTMRIAMQNGLLDQMVPWHREAYASDVEGKNYLVDYVSTQFPTIERMQLLYQFASAITQFADAKNQDVGGRSLASLPSFIATFVQQQDKPQNKQEGSAWYRSVEETMVASTELYRRLGVLLTREDERGESKYNDKLPGVVAELLEKKIAEVSDGATVVHLEGFETPLIIKKTDGGYVYGTTDLAAIRYRTQSLMARRIIYVVGSPQSFHFSQVFAVARLAGWDEGAALEHAGFGSVLGSDGKIFRTREGGTVKLKDLLDEAESRAYELVESKNASREGGLGEAELRNIARAVGIGAIKYFDLSRERNGDYRFSFDAMLSMDGNTAPYLQYAYARICSIFRKTDESAFTQFSLVEPAELTLARHLMRFNETLSVVARDLRPHVLCNYLYELATRFSGFYESCPVLKSEGDIRASRLALCQLTARTLARGLELLGIEHPERM